MTRVCSSVLLGHQSGWLGVLQGLRVQKGLMLRWYTAIQAMPIFQTHPWSIFDTQKRDCGNGLRSVGLYSIASLADRE